MKKNVFEIINSYKRYMVDKTSEMAQEAIDYYKNFEKKYPDIEPSRNKINLSVDGLDVSVDILLGRRIEHIEIESQGVYYRLDGFEDFSDVDQDAISLTCLQTAYNSIEGLKAMESNKDFIKRCISAYIEEVDKIYSKEQKSYLLDNDKQKSGFLALDPQDESVVILLKEIFKKFKQIRENTMKYFLSSEHLTQRERLHCEYYFDCGPFEIVLLPLAFDGRVCFRLYDGEYVFEAFLGQWLSVETRLELLDFIDIVADIDLYDDLDNFNKSIDVNAVSESIISLLKERDEEMGRYTESIVDFLESV